MSNMKSSNQIEAVKELFYQLQSLLISEGEDNWIRGINEIVTLLRSQSLDAEEDVLVQVKDTYKSMAAGNGSFSDFYIWRENPTEMRIKNLELDGLRTKIWHILFQT